MNDRMPFGKYRGWPLAALPGDYLTWLSTLDLREPLRGHVQHESARLQAQTHAPRAAAQLDTEIAKQIVQAGYRALALWRYPDCGGDTATMQRVNGTVEGLRQFVGAAEGRR